MNAFLPATEQDDPQRFSGRRKEVDELTNALHVNGSVPLIYGQRGLGKSSLAAQVTRIAQGDIELLSELGLAHLALHDDERFITLYVTCFEATKDLNAILSLMVNAVHSVKVERDSDPRRERFRLVDKTSRRKLTLKIFETESTRRFEKAVDAVDSSRLSLAERLVQLTDALTDAYQQPVLIVIDELDRVSRVRGLASFLRTYSSERLKFLPVGIAASQAELLSDHVSLGRKLVSVRVPLMQVPELTGIVDRTEQFLTEAGEPVHFADESKAELARLASGFPWFVHVIGQVALLSVYDRGDREIRRLDIDAAVSDLVGNRFAQQFADLYQTAIRDSYQREYVLRLFALWPDENIPTSVIYPPARRLGVSNPSTYLNHLTADQCKKVLVRAPQQDRALYQFSDEMFKVYVRIRPSLYASVKEQAERAMRRG